MSHTLGASQAFSPLSSIEQLDAVVERSKTQTVVLFKHSPTCGTSAYAYEEVDAALAETPMPAEFYLINVLRSRDVSREIASRFGIRHESPQMLVIRDGVVKWAKSHHSITPEAVATAVSALMGQK